MSSCANCGFHNPEDFRFCGSCGQPLGPRCSNCGSELVAGLRFCGQCGTPVVAGMVGGGLERPPEAPVAASAERRLVSVLFADLVGFTSLSEERDPEEVRDLLTRYFEAARRLIGRYGGTVEKFIGDAVMAVWGTPVAQEDDAERAVRAALELVDAIAALGEEVGAPDLRARAGVLTGEAAVTLGAEGQGMVAGDLVNTAARVQGLAAPGTVLVGEATRRTTEAAIVYEGTGSHELKGKAEPVSLWRAIRVIAGIGGAYKSVGLEAPFVGRDRELRLVKELFHASAEEGKAHLLSVVGVAGIGKSRLAWEFFKYVEGLADIVYWHRGRCLAYGEGVTYWALAEMVRMRARIAEGEEPEGALAKLRAAVDEHVPDPEERRWVEPRLAHLLGLEEQAGANREDLFSAWRLFFERLAQLHPTVLVFEDMQWADAALLDFIDHLLEWSRNHPMFVLALARPELAERVPSWGAGKRSFSSLHLEPLSAEAMDALLSGLVPGLPDRLREAILSRAEGVPLYAVETVRMLIDRGLLVQEDSKYRPAGLIDALEVPETLHALIAARLDGLSSAERRLVQDASVLGKTFTLSALSVINGLPETQLQALLARLVQKEVFGIQADPRSPERGQYGFLQDLVRRVAYEMLPKKERKARHLTVAGYLEGTRSSEEEELVQIAASHYLEAYRLAPGAPDAREVKERAREALLRAGNRAASLAASDEAQFYFEEALQLTDVAVEGARLAERAGEMARLGGRNDHAVARYEESIALSEAHGETHAAARVSARLAEIMWDQGHIRQAVERMERSFQILKSDEPDEDLATLTAQLARFYFFVGRPDLAAQRIETALEIAETLSLHETLSQALNTKSLILDTKSRHQEADALLNRALQGALEHDRAFAAFRAYYNLWVLAHGFDRHDIALAHAREMLALARKVGNRSWEHNALAALAASLSAIGKWDEALSHADTVYRTVPMLAWRPIFSRSFGAVARIYVNRGAVSEAEQLLRVLEGESLGILEGADRAVGRAIVLRAKGDYTNALDEAEQALAIVPVMGSYHVMIREACVEALESAFALGALEKVEELIASIEGWKPVDVPRFLYAHLERSRARVAAARGEQGRAEPRFMAAEGTFREIGVPFWLAVTLLEHGEWLVQQGQVDAANPLVSGARDIFKGLQAQPWLDRLAAAESPEPTVSTRKG